MDGNKVYVSVDVETTGIYPGQYSMLSFGACVIGAVDKQFYAELKPLADASFQESAMKVSCLGLECLPNEDVYNATSDAFDCQAVLSYLSEHAEDPAVVMKRFADWIVDVSEGKLPVIVTDIQPFDTSFIFWYHAKFIEYDNPFGWSGLNINMMYKGITRRHDASLTELNLIDDRNPPHHALEDAKFQAKIAERVFSFLDENNN